MNLGAGGAGYVTIIDAGTLETRNIAVGVYSNVLGNFIGRIPSNRCGQSSAVVANAGSDQTTSEEAPVQLDGTASTGSDLSFLWEQMAGPPAPIDNPSSPTPSFTAPQLPGGFGSQTLTFQLTVTSAGQSATDTVDITVVNVNHPPVAHAGDDQSVREGASVSLSAALSFDPDGDPLSWAWEQIGEPTVTLSGADTATPTFTAPLLPGGVGGAEVLTFRVTVSDGVLSASDDVIVVVEQDNHVPVANAGSPQTVSPGVLVTLYGSASSDPDGDQIWLLWGPGRRAARRAR